MHNLVESIHLKKFPIIHEKLIQKMWCIEKKMYFWSYIAKDFITKVFSMRKWKWLAKGVQSLSPLSSLAHLIVITLRSPPSWGKLLLQGKVFLGLEFYRVYFPFLLLIFFKRLVEVWILNGFLTSLWFAFLDYLFAWTLLLAPYFFFSPFLGCFF